MPNESKKALPTVATSLRIWQHSRLIPLVELEEGLQDRLLILRNHPEVCAMSHNQNLISYAAHQDYLRELRRHKPRFDSCVLYCDAIRLLKGQIQGQLQAADSDAANGLQILRPIIGVVNIDQRIEERPLLGLYKNLYHYPHIKMGRALLFAAMLRASELGLREVFLECYSRNVAMQKLARQLGFLPQGGDAWTRQVDEGRGGAAVERLLSYQRYLPSSKKLIQDPMLADFAELKRESASLGAPATKLRRQFL